MFPNHQNAQNLNQINDNYQVIRSHERGRAKQRWILLKGERYPSLSLLLCQNTPRHQCPNLLIPSLFPCIPDVCLIKKEDRKELLQRLIKLDTNASWIPNQAETTSRNHKWNCVAFRYARNCCSKPDANFSFRDPLTTRAKLSLKIIPGQVLWDILD